MAIEVGRFYVTKSTQFSGIPRRRAGRHQFLCRGERKGPVGDSYRWGDTFGVSKKPPNPPINAPTPIARTYAPISAIPDHCPTRWGPTLVPKKSTAVESRNETTVAAVDMLIA